MATPVPASLPAETREQRIQALLDQLRPQIEQTVRTLVERAVDVPEAEEFGPIDHEFRDAGLELANEIRRATLASRKKRGMSGPASTVRTAFTSLSSTPIRSGGS